VTSVGYARTYPIDVISASIEAPVPLTFEQPLPGWPIAVLGADDGDHLVLLTDGGRGLRRAVAAIPGIGMQLLKRAEEETIIAALVGGKDCELLLVTADGYARRLPLHAVFDAPKANHSGRVLISRRPLRAALRLAKEQPALLLTGAGLQEVSAGDIPCEADTTRSHTLLRLPPDTEVLQAVNHKIL